MTNLEEVLKYIDRIEEDEICEIIRAVNDRRTTLAMDHKFSMYIGCPVEFTNKGITHRGKVTKINKKNIKVEVPREGRPPMIWNVYPSFLKKIDRTTKLATI